MISPNENIFWSGLQKFKKRVDLHQSATEVRVMDSQVLREVIFNLEGLKEVAADYAQLFWVYFDNIWF